MVGSLSDFGFQYTEEKLGKAERTELDPHLMMLEKKTENTKNLTEKIKNNCTAVLIPNPGAIHCIDFHN